MFEEIKIKLPFACKTTNTQLLSQTNFTSLVTFPLNCIKETIIELDAMQSSFQIINSNKIYVKQ